MSYQTFHGVGGGPFKPNKDRGFWSNPHDFALACLNNAFRVDNLYGIAVVSMVVNKGFFYVLLLFFNGFLFAVPVFFIQSFLGQFSSSGYISALRISPLFKGLGYVALAVNLISLAFHGVLIAIPMLFLIHSMQPTLPWSCDTPHPWDKQLHLFIPTNSSMYEVDVFTSQCNLNYSEPSAEKNKYLLIPSVEFFRHQLSDFNLDIFACVLVTWGAVAYAVYHCCEKIGIILRTCTIVVLSLLIILFIRMLLLPDILKYVTIESAYYEHSPWAVGLVMPAIATFMTFGPGCCSVMSLASYNKFRTDFVRYSWQIPICQLVILILLAVVCYCAEMHLIKNLPIFTPVFEHQWMSFMTIPSTLATMDHPHLWTWMFLVMIILGVFNLTLIQMLSVQTAVLDEFEQLRPFRKELIFGCAAVMALISAFFCTKTGLKVVEIVVDMNLFSQSMLNLILIIVVLWVYGGDRFQRDVEFMASQVLPSWKFHYIRLVAPTFLGLLQFISFVFGMNYIVQLDLPDVLGSFCVAYLPWLALPIYCLYRLRHAIGDWKLRICRCIKATDWHPVDPEDKQRYDQMFANKETSQPLATVVL